MSGILDFRWQDAVDIFVVAFLVYRVLLFFVDTRAMQLVRGLLVIAAFGGVARALELRTISWVLGHLLGVVLIAIPIVFQPEIRRLLEEIGRGRLLSNRKGAEAQGEHYAEVVVKAVTYLEQHKIGALIVFQQETGLREIWRSAVHLRSEITQELLLSIFWPNNPLHDGAVIMDRQSVVAAACYLPLTDKNDISRWHGTRHRAAVGVTEVSDAFALVVSEEHGHTSLAVRGRLSRPLNEKQLLRFVRRYFYADGTGTPFMKRLRSEIETQWPNLP